MTEEELKTKQQQIEIHYRKKPDAKGIAFIVGIYGADGTDEDVRNMSSTFEELNFAVFTERDPTRTQLACLVKAAAAVRYPINYKFITFYFAGHGGINDSGSPYVIPMQLKGEDGKVVRVEEDIVSAFDGTKCTCLFFFDCCLSSGTSLRGPGPHNLPKKVKAPPGCLIAYATNIGYKSLGDKIRGGVWTHYLCKHLREPLSITTILSKTHDDVRKERKDFQPPMCSFSIGEVYLKDQPQATAIPSQHATSQGFLTSSDLQTVLEETIEVTDWREVGGALGIKEYRLDRIEDENKKVLARQRQMYRAWIDTGKATWKSLCDALRKTTVDKGGVADKIEQKYC